MPSLPGIEWERVARLALCSALLCLACSQVPQDAGEAPRLPRSAPKALQATVPGKVSATASLTVARLWHTATLLPSGHVLVAGGSDSSGGHASAEVYDPATGQWSLTGSLATPRARHTATLLPSGQVLVSGGAGSSGSLTSAEVYDPATGQWSPTGPLATARSSHTATLLPSGKVLVSGGYDGGFLASTEVYDPDTGIWNSTGSLAAAHYLHTATLLPSGKVLVSGGWSPSGADAEVYNPATGSWSATGTLTVARDSHTATLLPSGKVLVSGGGGSSGSVSTEVYDPASGAWSATAPLASARYGHTATLLPSGKVLVTGGTGPSGDLASAEIYEPPPSTPTLTAPGALVNTSRPAIAGTADPANTVEIWLDGTVANTTQADAQGQWSFTPSTTLSAGLHQAWGVASNGAGNESFPSELRSFTVELPQPAVSVPGSVNSARPAIAGTAEPGSLVTVKIDGIDAGTAIASPAGLWVFAPLTPLSSGIHTVKVTIKDPAGKVSLDSEGRDFTVDLEQPGVPTVSVSRIVNTQHPFIDGTAEAKSTVTLSLDGSVTGTAMANSDGHWFLIVATALTEGPHNIEAMATDPAGNVSDRSAAITCVVDVRPPDAPEISPLDDFINTQKPSMGGTSETDTTVTVWVDGKKAGLVEVTPAGSWSFTPTQELKAGTHQVRATAQDEAGNISEPSAERSFAIRRSHYGWSCATTPAAPATWALWVLALLSGRRWGRHRSAPQGTAGRRRLRAATPIAGSVRTSSGAAARTGESGAPG